MIPIIIQARMGSSRLPGKVMKKINDKPLLYYIINQVKACTKISKIIIATTNLEEDNVIASAGNSYGIEVFRGNSLDVLDRYYNCAKELELKNIIRLSADCPLIDFNLIDKCISKFEEDDFDYLSNTIKKIGGVWKETNNGYPTGMAVEIFTFDALEKAWRESTKPTDREHVTEYIFHNPSFFKLGNMENERDLSDLRLVVDYPEDFELIEKIITSIDDKLYTIPKLQAFLDKNPKLKMINSMHVRK